jgi:pimeloyl-ACP methyl ester carboxylesterase
LTQPKIHFSHANGLPASTYSYLFEMLENTDICFVEKMGHGDYPFNGNWHNCADELIASIEQHSSEPVIGVGHSFGAVVTLIAASKRPELFKKVILLDPVLFSKRKRFVIGLFRAIGLGDLLGPTRRTLVRRSQFDNEQQAAEYFSPKTLFKNFHPRCFNDYIKHGLKPTDKGLELAISPAIEADVFRTALTKVPTNLDKVNGVVIYGDKSKVFERSDRRWWKKNLPNFELVAFSGEHLFPLEAPQEVARILNPYIA